MPLKIMCITHDNISVNFTNGATLVGETGVKNNVVCLLILKILQQCH